MENIFQFLPEQASTFAKHLDALYLYLVAVSVFFSILIFTLAFVFAIKYKRRYRNEKPKQIHGNLLLEIVWTIIPLIIAMSFFVLGTILFINHYRIPKDALEIFVVGKQWMWKIQHPEGPREINNLHIPINQPIKLTMTSEDVIHSFYVPAFRVKMDVVPGKYTQAWFEATKPGSYHLFCAEYCGTKHSQMIGKVVAMRPEDYEKWLSERVDPADIGAEGNTMAGKGKRLFRELRCVSCHHANSGALGPDLAGVFGSEVTLADGQKVKADEAYLRESILNPNKKLVAGYAPLMPTFKNQVDEEQLLSILAYLKTLKSEEKTNAQN